MGLELRQQLKLTQQLVMTPQLQQAIKLLQLSRLELLDTVNQELLENPLLEETLEELSEEGEHISNNEVDVSAQVLSQGDEEVLKSADWEDYLGEFSSTGRQLQGKEREAQDQTMAFDARLSASPSLHSHLSWQLKLSGMNTEEQSIGEYIIGNLNSSGYLAMPTHEIEQELGFPEDKVEEILRKIQLFDPIGVAARNIKECLNIQLIAMNFVDEILFTIIDEHLEDIERKQFKNITKRFKIRMEDLKEYIDIIQSLEPMPGSSFGGDVAQYVSPDVYVYRYGEDFVIVLNDDGLPKLQLSPFYMDDLSSRSSEDKDYLQDKMRSAQWLMKSLYQRQRTLFKVAESIVKFQRDFFVTGVSELKPLILRDVAEDIDMHESTVSRITTNKYLASPHGIFELKYFFNSALGSDDGGQVGSESVKAAIKNLVSEENPKKPLSDERIAAILKDKLGVNIARRTVAKYRAALNIPSSSKRKEYF